MAKQKPKGNKLPPLQRRVVLCLAQKGSQTKNEVNTNIPLLKLAEVAHYKPTWVAIKSLTKKGLIQEVGTKHRRGQNYPTYWLTDEGVFVALIEGANSKTLLNKTRKLFPKNKALLCYLDIAPKFNPKIFEIAYSAVKTKGKLEPIDVATMLFTQMQTETTIETFRELMEILKKKYPKLYNSIKEQIENMSQNLNQIKETIFNIG